MNTRNISGIFMYFIAELASRPTFEAGITRERRSLENELSSARSLEPHAVSSLALAHEATQHTEKYTSWLVLFIAGCLVLEMHVPDIRSRGDNRPFPSYLLPRFQNES